MTKKLKLRPLGARKIRTDDGRISQNGISDVRYGYFRAADGTRLFYSVEGKGRPLIFCYGLVCSSLHWTYQIGYFRNRYQTAWYDYRGHHNSDRPKDLGSLTIPSIAADLKTLMDELGLQDAVLLGHSMGVNIVLDFYRQFPERVYGMILANGTAQRPFETMFHVNAVESFFSVLEKLNKKSPRLMSAFWKAQGMNPLVRSAVALAGFNPHLSSREDIDLYIDEVLSLDPELFLTLIRNYQTYDATPWLHTVRVPTLILGGEKDHIVPRQNQELMHQLIPESRLEVIHHGSHCTQMDLPDLVNLKVDGFLKEIGYLPMVASLPESNPLRESASQSTETHLGPRPPRDA